MTGGGAGGTGVGSSNANNNTNENLSSWLELESDPGLFTLLVDDFGVKGVQVEEIYDLTKPLDNSIFGFIFLFKWIERRGRRNKSSCLEPNSNYVTDSNIVNKMFFAHQIVPNSCATHALLSVLLNCNFNKYLDLGDLLDKFKKLCDGKAPEIKGLAIGNQPRLAQAHNSYAKPESNRANFQNSKNYSSNAAMSSNASSSSPASSSATNLNHSTSNSSLLASNSQCTINSELFHFICFVPINGRLYELDGLKPYPVDHGPIQPQHTDSKFNSQLLEQMLANEQLATGANSSSSNLQHILSNLLTNYLSSVDSGYSNWTNKFRQIILQRLSSFNSGQQNHEIRFNLMAVVPDKILILKEQIDLLNENKKKLFNLIQDVTTNINENLAGVSVSSASAANSPQAQNEAEALIDSKDLLNAPRQLRSSKISSPSLSTSTPVISNGKKLNGTVTSIPCKAEDQLQYEIVFDLWRNESINELLKNLNSSTKINFFKFKQDLVKLIDKFDFVELCKIFKFEKSTPNSTTADWNENLFVLEKLVSFNQLKQAEAKLDNEIDSEQSKFNEEIDKRKKYKIEALRRKHVYDEFIVTYLKILAENGKLEEIVKNSLTQRGTITANGNNTNNSTAPTNQQNSTSSFYISPNSLFLQQPATKKQRKK